MKEAEQGAERLFLAGAGGYYSQALECGGLHAMHSLNPRFAPTLPGLPGGKCESVSELMVMDQRVATGRTPDIRQVGQTAIRESVRCWLKVTKAQSWSRPTVKPE